MFAFTDLECPVQQNVHELRVCASADQRAVSCQEADTPKIPHLDGVSLEPDPASPQMLGISPADMRKPVSPGREEALQLSSAFPGLGRASSAFVKGGKGVQERKLRRAKGCYSKGSHAIDGSAQNTSSTSHYFDALAAAAPPRSGAGGEIWVVTASST